MVVYFCIFLFIIFALLHIPGIQKHITAIVTNRLVQQSGDRVEIGSSVFDVYSGVQIKHIKLIDHELDTLLSIDEIIISPKSTLLSLFHRLSVNDIELYGTHVNVIRKAHDEQYNWERLITALSSTDDGSTKDFPLDLSFLQLHNMSVNIIDDHTGYRAKGSLDGLELDIEKLNTDNIHIHTLSLLNPQFVYQRADTTPKRQNNGNDFDIEDINMPQIVIEQFNMINANISEQLDSSIYELATDVTILTKDLQFHDWNMWDIIVDDISGQWKSFDISHFGIYKVLREHDQLSLTGLEAVTSHSTFSADFNINNLKKITDWNDAQYIVNLRRSIIRPSDFTDLIPAKLLMVNREPWFTRDVQINGTMRYEGYKLELDKLSLWIDRTHHLSASGLVSKIDDINNSHIDLSIHALEARIPVLDLLSKEVDIPDMWERLGDVSFNGHFKGSTSEFKSVGMLQSTLGHVEMDIQIDQKDSIFYDGTLQLTDFDLGQLLAHTDIGLVNGEAKILDGRGRSIDRSVARLEADISQFQYKGYDYRGATFDGRLSSRTIDGHFEIEDKAIDITFDGSAILSADSPAYDFTIDVDYMDLCALNLSQFPCQLSFDSEVNLKGKNFNEIVGETIISDIVMVKDADTLHIDKIDLSSSRLNDGQMKFDVKSDFVDLVLAGEFNLLEIPKSIRRQLVRQHPEHAKLMGLAALVETQPFYNNFQMNGTVWDVSTLMNFLGVPLTISPNTSLSGVLKEAQSAMSLQIVSDSCQYKTLDVKDLNIAVISGKNVGNLKLDMGASNIAGVDIRHLKWNTDIIDHQLLWNLNIEQNENNFVELESRSKLRNEGYFTEILYDHVKLDGSTWTILPNQGIGIYKNSLQIDNIVLTDGRRSVGIRDINQVGLETTLKEFDFKFINPLINYDKLYFEGFVDAQIKVDSLYSLKGIEGFAHVPALTINGDYYGTLDATAARYSEDTVSLDLSIVKDTQRLVTKGLYDTKEKYIDAYVDIDDYPMDFFEYIITEGISETQGKVDVDVVIEGDLDIPDEITMRGKGFVKNAGVKIDYIGAFYRMDQEEIAITEREINLDGATLYDERNNTATIRGGLNHYLLADFRANADIISPTFIALNTTIEDNPAYYGTGMGPLEVSFRGPFDAIDMEVDATAGPLSSLSIPITSTQYGYDQSYVNFDYHQENVEDSSIDELIERLKESGVNFKMNLSFQREAEVQIIYDEETSNVLIGHGEGDIRLTVTRDGDFSVFGQYNVESGEYLYTAFGFIAKPFIIRQGGTVTWTGDPINAVLDVEAYSPNLRAPLKILLQEYIDGSSVPQSEFSIRREVDLTLGLSENLFNPTISFDIDFPNLDGQIKTLADSKIRTLRTTENGINNQVVGLMVFRNFLPDNNPFATLNAGSIGQAGNNTITEFLTSQLSLLFTDYLSDQLKGDIISGIDFDIALAQNDEFLGNQSNTVSAFFDLVPDEVQVHMRNRFKNENFVLNLGGNYVRDNPINPATNYLTGDFSLDWFITADRRLKLRFYAVYDYQYDLNRRQKYGFGINFRKEFGTLRHRTFQGLLDELVKEVNNLEPL